MNEIETDVAREVFNIGMANAAKSLAFFTQETMHLQYSDLKLFPGKEAAKHFSDEILNKNHVLITELIGDFSGVSYLLLNQDEVDFICKRMLPASVLENADQAEMMTDNLLLELDNIVSAAAVTQFANLLKCKLHGGVPSLRKTTFGDFFQHEALVDKEMNTLLFSVSFTAGDLKIEPSFVWLIDAEFFNQIQKVIDSDEALRLLSNKDKIG